MEISKHAAKKRRERDKRYLAKFYVGVKYYDALLAEQDGKCGVCGRPATDFTVSLNFDHFHFRIETDRIAGGWMATTTNYDGRIYTHTARTKQQAIDDLKRLVMPQSIRGLLCPGRYTGCNRLMGRIDKPDWLRKVIHYLENSPAEAMRAAKIRAIIPEEYTNFA
jgi:Recombination endonuclease VII